MITREKQNTKYLLKKFNIQKDKLFIGIADPNIQKEIFVLKKIKKIIINL